MAIRVLNVVGARPNFMKVAPIVRAMVEHPGFSSRLVHTGQHYDAAMSKVFFDDLGLPVPDLHLGVGSGSHAVQTARILMASEQVLMADRPDVILVVGDVNSTLACALAAAKLKIPVAHVEAGLRSRNLAMPEELNRLLTDRLSRWLFTPSADADANLLAEGHDPAHIHRVGNVMIDSLLHHRRQALARSPVLAELGVAPRAYAVLTLHRPETVDHPERLLAALTAVRRVAAEIPVVYPVHPRTRRQMDAVDLDHHIRLLDPLGYLDFLALMDQALFVLTDSGGIQEETTVLGVPCLTLREETERPITVSEGTNTVVGLDAELIFEESSKIMRGAGKSGRVPELWDGAAAERIVSVLAASDGSGGLAARRNETER
jgi:UDP-N-acetylglucosamine 2-epimerase (non-hydrolysing)